jgi:uncharacterized protein (DUF1330 family)
MPVYMIVEAVEVSDKEMYGAYIRAVPDTIAQFGGTYLVRGGRTTVIGGNWEPVRLIVVAFPSMDAFRSWWESPEYRAIAPLRERSTRTNVVIADGVDGVPA